LCDIMAELKFQEFRDIDDDGDHDNQHDNNSSKSVLRTNTMRKEGNISMSQVKEKPLQFYK